jgi:hypothetical protein
MESFMGGIAPLDPGLRAEPLFTTHLRAKYGTKYGTKYGAKYGAPLKEKTAHMERTQPSNSFQPSNTLWALMGV